MKRPGVLKCKGCGHKTHTGVCGKLVEIIDDQPCTCSCLGVPGKMTLRYARTLLNNKVARKKGGEWESDALEMFRSNDYLACHFRPMRTARGWMTPVVGDAGLPDIIAVSKINGTVFAVETKYGERAMLSEVQTAWKTAFEKNPNNRYRLWRPEHRMIMMAEIQEHYR